MSIAFFSMGFLTGTYLVLDNSVTDCGGIRFILWMVIVMHTLNILVTFVNLCGLETKIFNSNMVCGFSLFEIGILIFMQVTYFESQENKCMTAAPDLYFWLMS